MGSHIKLILCMVFWGGTFVAGRSLAGDVPPYCAAFLRFAIASLVLWFACQKLEGGLPKLDAGLLLGVAILGATGVFSYNVLFFGALERIQAGRASIIVAQNPVFIALLSVLIFKEKLSLINGLGMAVCVSGSLMVITRGDFAHAFSGGLGLGEIMMMGCVASWVSYSLMGKVVMRRISPLSAVTYSCMIGSLMLLPFALNQGLFSLAPGIRPASWAWLGFMGLLASAMAFVWFYSSIKAIGAARTGIFITLVPICAVIQAFLILGESVDDTLIYGLLLVTFGLFLTNRKPATKSVASAGGE